MIDIFPYCHHFAAWYYTDIVRKKSVLVTHGIWRVKWLALEVNTTYKYFVQLTSFQPFTHNNSTIKIAMAHLPLDFFQAFIDDYTLHPVVKVP